MSNEEQESGFMTVDDAVQRAGLRLVSHLGSITDGFAVRTVELAKCQRQGNLIFSPEGDPVFTVSSERTLVTLPTTPDAVEKKIEQMIFSLQKVLAEHRGRNVHVGAPRSLVVIGSPRSWVDIRANVLEMQAWLDVSFNGTRLVEGGAP